MADEIEKTTQQTTEAVQEMGMSLTDLIAGMIQATVDADQAVTDDYMQTFKEYAFEKDPNGGNDRLQMVDFEMVDNEGVRRLVSIPKLSLLPLPVLHVSEATFDIDAKITATAKEETVEDKPDTVQATPVRGRKDATDALLGRTKAKTLDASNFRLVVQSGMDTKLSKFRSTHTTGGQAQQAINARIHIELRPSTLPSGMRGALKVADATVREIEIEKTS